MNLLYIKRAVYKFLKQSKVVFNLHEWFLGYKDIRVQKEVNKVTDLKPKQQINKEKQLIKDYWSCGTFHYWRYGLQYKKLSNDEILDYVPTYFHHRNLENKHIGIDTIKYGNKLTQAYLFKKKNIPSPSIIAIYKNKNYFDLLGNTLNSDSVINDKLKMNGSKLFFKPINGSGGSGIFVLKYLDNNFFLNGEKFHLKNLGSTLSKDKTYIIEENIVQNQQMMSINSSSVNTLRVVVQNENGKMQLKTCIIRMGRSGKEVDNSAQGGVSVKVDLKTGELAARATAEHGGGVITEHPDSKRKFAGMVINNWENIKLQIERIANKLIDYNDIALDIAITEEGVLLIEFNFRYGIEHQQCVIGGVRRILNISNN